MLIDYFLLLVNNKLQNYPFSQHMFVDNRNKRWFIYSLTVGSGAGCIYFSMSSECC